MLAALAIGAVAVSTIAGAAFNAARTSKAVSDLAEAYTEAADEIRSATKEYSGDNAYKSNLTAAGEMGRVLNKRALDSQLNRAPSNNSTAMANAANLNGDYASGYGAGMDLNQSKLDANYNAKTIKAQQALKQAGIDYNVRNAQTQAMLGGVGTALKSAGAIGSTYGGDIMSGLASLKSSDEGSDSSSDERVKKGINNKSGLPASDIEDSLRQLETIQYKYKDPSVPGCDDEVHKSGFTAQSLEKTPMNKKMGIVNEGEDGVKRIDNWKLQEALMAGMAQMQREIDALTGRNK